MTDDLADDAVLLQRAAAGDAGAFGSFVARHQAGVWQRARALTHVGADAEDLLQETFLSAWRGAAGFRGGNARAWLLTIAGHAWERLGRRAVRLEAHGAAESLEALALRAGWGTTDEVGEDERTDIVREAFERLSSDDQHVLMLRHVEEVPGDEAAQLLGLSLPAMKSRLHRARLRLAAAYEEVRHGSAR